MQNEIIVAVIIPYFQRKPGVLRAAVESVLRQQALPGGVIIDLIIVNDDSPISPRTEIEGLGFPQNVKVRVVDQRNQGCAAARNTGLDLVTNQTEYVAFLDSDDTWHKNYLITSLTSLESGYDLFFCDNERPGHHVSQYFSNLNLIRQFLVPGKAQGKFYTLSAPEFTSLMLRDFPAQVSTITYRHSASESLRFNTSVRTAGEDMLFFLEMGQSIRSACFSDEVLVTCGEGINMYFGHLNWDSPGHLRQVYDRMRSHRLIHHLINLNHEDRVWNNKLVQVLRRKFVYLSIRYAFRNRGRIPVEIYDAIKQREISFSKVLSDAIYVLLGRACNFYHPP